MQFGSGRGVRKVGLGGGAESGARDSRLASLFHPFPVVNEGTLPGGCELVAFKDDGWFTMKRKLELNTPVFDRYR